MKRVTQGEVAKAAGVHRTTVGLALRGHPRIPKETRRSILSVAKRMGYRPDPCLNGLAAYRRGRKGGGDYQIIAFLTDQKPGADPLADHFLQRYINGAREQCRTLGFKLDPIRFENTPDGLRVLDRTLTSRGIGAAIVGPLSHPESKLTYGFAGISAVAIHYSLSAPQLDRVVPNNTLASSTALKQMAAKGYKRIGLVLSTVGNTATARTFLAGFLLEREYLPEGTKAVARVFAAGKDWNPEGVARWIRAEGLEAVLCVSPVVHDWCLQSGFAMPEELGLASLNSPGKDSRLSGIDQRLEDVGAAAVEKVAARVYHNLTGVPRLPVTILVDGKWKNGHTLTTVRAGCSIN